MDRDEQVELLRKAPLVTGRYGSWKPGWGVPVRITRGVPRYWSRRWPFESLHNVPGFAPSGAVFLEPDDDVARGLFMAQLDQSGHEAVERLALLASQHEGERMVMMCFEDVAAGECCHRTWVADWLELEYGLTVPELSQSEVWFGGGEP